MSPRRVLAGLGLAALAALSPTALAQQATVNIDINPELAKQAGIDGAQVEQDLQAAMDSELKLDSQAEFLSQMARAALMAGKGMGADYASNPQRFIVGGSFGSAVNSAGARFGRGDDGLPLGGFAFQAAAMGGLNLGAFSKDDSPLRRFVIYVNGMAAEGRLDPFHAEFYNVGAHLQINIIGSAGEAKAIEWGGLDLTSGYELASYKLRLEQGLPIEADPVTWDATGSLTIGTSSASVPIELSTNLRILVATVFAGAAYDYNMPSSATTEFALYGPIMVSQDGVGEQVIGNADVSLTDSGADVPSSGRVFAGAQVELLWVKAYGQLNIGFEDSFGGHIGVRVGI